jgi:glycosyltransferase involved in cell wall biosynthesis
LNQTFAELDILVIDDGSTDGTARILEDHKKRDNRLRVVSAEGSGLVDALNQAIGLTTAPLIARMDADDVALPNRLELQRDYMHLHPEIAVAGAQVRYIDEEGRPLGRTTTLPTSAPDVS